MHEAVTRRFQRYLDGDEKFSPLPDLLLIDGGAVHANTALQAINDLGISVPVFGMVKDDRHRTRALETPEGEEIALTLPSAFSFIGRIQEEVHRFAITYQRSTRSAALRYSELDGIEGVGPARKSALLKKYGSLKAIAAADETELSSVVPRDTAHNIYVHFHGDGREVSE